ncbi:hypothetical protein PVA17_24395 [Lysinibacillus sp. CNPSo 3705]|uniref:hypothetical protein n=1 Tax=Lysinibacillus sp. CNPSo 3705 TaxID=3028148 RepID=UPI002363FD58|nr:hypothetical protein [Lysinibacillus sp. CNPSo 3705]MDD1505858.1 hypothetical protein [Lysinibacillus sp. CNPSo 3705]
MEESRKKLTVAEKQAYVLDTYKDDPLLLYIQDREAQKVFMEYAQDFFENVEIDKHYTNNTATQLLGFKYSQKILNILNDSKYANYLRTYKKGNQYRHNIEVLFKLLLITFLSESLLLNAPDISTILGEDATYTSLSDDNERINNSGRQNINPNFVKALIAEGLNENMLQMQEGFKQFAEELEKRELLKEQQYLNMQNTLLEHITFTEKVSRKELELVEAKNKMNQLQAEINYLEAHIKTEERQLAENKRTIAVLVDREQETSQQATMNSAEEMTVNVPIPSGKKYIPRFFKSLFFIEEGEDISEQSVKITKEKDNETIEHMKQRQATLLKHIEDLTLEQGNITASIDNNKDLNSKLKSDLQICVETVKELEEQLHGLKSNKSIESLKKQLVMPTDIK